MTFLKKIPMLDVHFDCENNLIFLLLPPSIIHIFLKKQDIKVNNRNGRTRSEIRKYLEI